VVLFLFFHQESYGEDPYLTGQLVTQYVHGLQGNDARYVRANAGCKHFAAYAGPENIPVSRFSFDAKVSARYLFIHSPIYVEDLI